MRYLKQTTDVVCGLSQKSSSVFCNTAECGEKSRKKGQFLSWYSHLFSFKHVFLWSKAKKFLPKQHSMSKMKPAAAFQSEHNTERLQLPSPAHWTDLGPVPALGRGWESDDTVQVQLPPALAAGSLQLLWQLPMDGRAAAVSSSDPTVRGCLPQAGTHHPQPATSMQGLKTLCKGLPLKELTQKLFY